MNLEDACAAYFIERDSLLDELHPDAKDYPDTSISWHRERDKRALDEAVKAVALAAVREVDVAIHTDWTEMRVSRIFREAVAELERLLEVKHD